MPENNENNEVVKLLSNVEGEYLTYKGKPLVRENNRIIYGLMEDKYFLSLTIMNTKEQNGQNVPDKVLVQVVSTDKSLSSGQRIAKQDLKSGLFDAFELGIIWLERYNNQ